MSAGETICEGCGIDYTGDECPVCHQLTPSNDDTLDTLVQDASTPSLAALIQAGKDQGLIKPTVGYAST